MSRKQNDNQNGQNDDRRSVDITGEGEDEPLITCPVCGEEMPYCNVGRDHWFYCEKDKVKYLAGSNMFSSWRDETEAAWRDNKQKLDGFKVVSL